MGGHFRLTDGARAKLRGPSRINSRSLSWIVKLGYPERERAEGLVIADALLDAALTLWALVAALLGALRVTPVHAIEVP